METQGVVRAAYPRRTICLAPETGDVLGGAGAPGAPH